MVNIDRSGEGLYQLVDIKFIAVISATKLPISIDIRYRNHFTFGVLIKKRKKISSKKCTALRTEEIV